MLAGLVRASVSARVLKGRRRRSGGRKVGVVGRDRGDLFEERLEIGHESHNFFRVDLQVIVRGIMVTVSASDMVGAIKKVVAIRKHNDTA